MNTEQTEHYGISPIPADHRVIPWRVHWFFLKVAIVGLVTELIFHSVCLIRFSLLLIFDAIMMPVRAFYPRPE